MSRFTHHVSRWWPFAAILVLVLLFFNQMAFSNLILARGDTFLYFYPYWEAAAAALRNGRIPLWNPDIFMGAPFLANSQVGFFYPFNWPVWWLLPTPYAVKASIIFHLLVAGWGTYLAGRRALSLSRGGAILAAVLFALGGYLTAQVEHINQLQGLAWLPWFLVVFGKGRLETGDWRLVLRRGTAVAALFSLQLLAGHTQTAFITGVGVGLYQVAGGRWRVARGKWQVPSAIYYVVPLFLGVVLALLVTAVQLLPTLELANYSSRQGGLTVNEVLSFSLHPLLLGRSLLPGYGQSLFTEYVAFLPLTALLLATIGMSQWRQRSAVRPIVVVTAVAFILALGRFTPVYWLLARLPGFDLFRVPARWLVWYALGMALLAGLGWDVMHVNLKTVGWRRNVQRPLRWGFVFIILLMAWNWLVMPLVRFIPLGPETPAVFPARSTILGWFIELTTFFTLLTLISRQRQQHPLRHLVTLSPLYLVSLAALFFATRSLPANQLTTPEAYFDLRPPIARLQAVTANEAAPGRLLSLSNIFFDPGDQAEIDTIYRDQLPEQARFDYTVAIKQKEIIAPNLPMTFGLASVDGFDGGILPLSAYSQLMQIILPAQTGTVDGRLREYLTAVPPPHWLDLFNARYLITDKTGDIWREIAPGFSAFFDLQHPVTAAVGTSIQVGYVPDFPATGLALIAEGAEGEVIVEADGQRFTYIPQAVADNLWLVDWPDAVIPETILLRASSTASWQIKGFTLFNLPQQTFQPLVPGQYRLIHSGEVKIYENLDVLPRAFLLSDWQWVEDAATAVSLMQADTFNPQDTAVLLGSGGPVNGSPLTNDEAIATIAIYTPEQVVVQIDSPTDALLLLTDAHYPGWQAAVDGQPQPIYQADVLFRGVMVPAGQHEVVFTFVSQGYGYGRVASLVGLAFWVLLAIFSASYRKSN